MAGTPRRIARRIASRLPDQVVDRAGSELGRAARTGSGLGTRVRRTWHRSTPVPGLLSIVVPCYQVEDYLDECLISLRFQHYRQVEIIVVDDGSPDRSGEIARAQARRDLRVRVVRRPNGGLSAARNTGIEHARGEFITFLDSDDTVPPDAFTNAVSALQESGSDFAVSYYDRLKEDQYHPAGRWIRDAHGRRRLATTLDEFPEAMVNAVAWGKVYRREFWDRAGLVFPEGRLYEDQPVSMSAFALARTFDVLPEVGVHWRIRADQSSISQRSSSVKNLAEHNATVRDSLANLVSAGKSEAAGIRAAQLLANNMPYFTRHLITGGDDFWQLLREGIGDLLDVAPRELFQRWVTASDKMIDELIVADRRADAEEFLEQFGQELQRFQTHAREDGVHADLPFADTLPDYANMLSETQVDLAARILRVAWADDGSLHLDGWAYLRNLDLAESPPVIGLELVSPDGSERHRLEVESRDEPRLDAVGGHWYANYRPGGFRATLPAGSLPARAVDWHVEVTITAAGVTRVGPVNEIALAGSGGVVQAHPIAPGYVAKVASRLRQLLVSVTEGPYVVRTEASPRGRATVTFSAGDLPVREVVLAHHDRRRPLLTAAPRRTADGWAVELDLTAIPASAQSGERATAPMWVCIDGPDGIRTPLLAQADLPRSPGVPPDPTDTASHVLTRGRHGELEVLDRVPVAIAPTVTDDEFVITVAGPAAMTTWAPVLETSKDRIAGTWDESGPRPRIVFALTRTRWAREGLALSPGKYTVSLVDSSGTRIPVTPAAELVDVLPYDVALTRYRGIVELQVARVPTLAITLAPPLADDERGARNQRRLREEAQAAVADEDSVFFRALYGDAANCNGLGVHHELRRRGSELTLYWSIADRSVPVPDGAIGLVQDTRAWHYALARSRYHMINVHQIGWFTKPEGQVMIQTMHGYPYKVMGHEWWSKGGFLGSQILNFDRRAREWDYFVSPASYATPLLRKAFLEPAGATCEVLEIGYPRNDVLVSDEGAQIRERTRADLGIRPDQVAVMYAPTFRDYMSLDDLSAKRVDFLDVERASEMLGDGFVLLVRGHAFNARSQTRLFSERVIDVTDHPDINDLILASDVAVLDYSSLRFDYGITDKPMIFLVPDLARYDAARGGVIDYLPTAPGPRVTTTAEVVGLLHDLDGLRATSAPLIEQFRRDYVDLDDGHASARLVDAVFVPRGDAPSA